MKKYIIFIWLFALIGGTVYAQTEIRGAVFEKDEEGKDEPIVGATVILLKAKKGQYTNEQGKFKFDWSEGDTLVFRALSYEDDTLLIEPGKEYYRTTLVDHVSQATVEIRARIPASAYSMIETQQVQLITRAELGKSACCNLGESFQANGSVDVTATDAATGSREIRLLGLAGRYSQLLTEKRPMTRGLSAIYGLNYIPGDWVESIQIAKGAGSVVDGYESMTGQINVEERKPFDSPPLHVNLYVNNFGRAEANVVSGWQFSPRVSTAVLAHGEFRNTLNDPNEDGFLNVPNGHGLILQNRWHIQLKSNLEMQFGGQYLEEDRIGGSNSFDPKTDKGSNQIWGLGINTRQISAFAKSGFTSQNRQFRSGGLILSGFQHEMDSYFGLRTYEGLHQNFRASFTFQDFIQDTRYTYRAGGSFLYDSFDEQVDDSSFARTEAVPGVFGEFTWKPKDGFSLVAGLRGDQHNLFGTLISPRLHVCWSPWEKTSLRLSGGRGYRTANPIAENIAVLASSRRIVSNISSQQEQSWTFGVGWVQQFSVGDRDASLVIDAYRTQFVQQLVADREIYNQLAFYTIQGGSFSNVAQIEANVEVLPRVDVRLAWRMQDVKTTFDGELREMPFTANQQGLVNFAWRNEPERWLADLTVALTGPQRLPSLAGNDRANSVPLESPAFLRINAQVTRKFGKTLEIYLGGENLGNYTQNLPVIAANEPFGPYFDASVAWGPLMGRMIYTGLRWDINKKNQN